MILLLGALLSILFVIVVHFVVDPLTKYLYRKWEPRVWHWQYKFSKKVKKSWGKVRGFLHRKAL